MKCTSCGHRVVEFEGKLYHKGLFEPMSVICDKKAGYYRDWCMKGTCSCQRANAGGGS